MLPVREQILANAAALPQSLVAFEALWDGDSDGWYVVLSAILKSEDGYRAQGLGALQDGGDMRLFNGQVPPWGEALLAQQFGEEPARKFGVPFYFPSPNHPEEDCPRWWERDQGYLRTDNASWRFFRQRIVELSSLGSDSTSWRSAAVPAHLRTAPFPFDVLSRQERSPRGTFATAGPADSLARDSSSTPPCASATCASRPGRRRRGPEGRTSKARGPRG
jgi:hypothetical protein